MLLFFFLKNLIYGQKCLIYRQKYFIHLQTEILNVFKCRNTLRVKEKILIEVENHVTHFPYGTSLECKQKWYFAIKIQMILDLLCLLYQCVCTDFSVNHAQVQQSKMIKTLNYNQGGGEASKTLLLYQIPSELHRQFHISKSKNISPTRKLIIGRNNSTS